jgi:hypothetical protein
VSLEVELLRYAFLRSLQVENECSCIFGKPCRPERCGCELEMQRHLDEARNAIVGDVSTPGEKS